MKAWNSIWIFWIWQELVIDTVQHCFLHKSSYHSLLEVRCDTTWCIASRNISVCECKTSSDHELNCAGIRTLDKILPACHYERILLPHRGRSTAQLPKGRLALRGGWGIRNDRYYEVLGLHRVDFPSDSVIKKAYHKAALAWHPDRNREQPYLDTFSLLVRLM